jgi:hypothetical protein
MNNNSTKNNTKSRLTDRKVSFYTGVLISIILVLTPFVFYIYKYAPADSQVWETPLGTITANGFLSVQSFIHAAFTKITFVLLTGIWFLTAKNWWKHAILVPFTLFLFQLLGVINHELQYIDMFDFWYSLPLIIPILMFMIYISYRISKRQGLTITDSEVDEEIKNILSDDL